MAPQLAWIGLGNMGRGMCKNLIEKGQFSQPLIVFNRTLERASDFQKSHPDHVAVAPSIEDAVSKSNIIFTCLGDHAAVQATVDTICKTDIQNKLFVDCSTVHPDTTNETGSTLSSHGASFVACPVFGAPAMADAGQLICVLAGTSESIDKVLPYCKGVMGRANIEYRDQPCGQATLLKVIGNTLILNMVEALAESHTLTPKSNLGTPSFHEFISTMFPGPYTAYSTRLTSGSYHERESPLFAVDLARKDAKHALDLAKANGVRMKAVEVVDGHLEDVQKLMGKKGDAAGIYGAVRRESGLAFEN